MVGALAVGFRTPAAEIKGQIKSIDQDRSQLVIRDDETRSDVVVRA
jgi:hypothetical protein